MMKKSRDGSLSANALIITITTMAIMTHCQGFNITYILNRQHKRFSTLNHLLSQTNIAAEINLRRPITLLAFDNAAAAASPIISSSDVKKLLAAHVILEYYNVEKLTSVAFSGGKTTLSTLFGDTGAVEPSQGLLKVSLVGEGEIAVGSAAAGGDLGSKLVETVFDDPGKISVIQITAPIMVPGIAATPPEKMAGEAPSPAVAVVITPPEKMAGAPSPAAAVVIPPPPTGRAEENISFPGAPSAEKSEAGRGSAATGVAMAALVMSGLVAKLMV